MSNSKLYVNQKGLVFHVIFKTNGVYHIMVEKKEYEKIPGNLTVGFVRFGETKRQASLQRDIFSRYGLSVSLSARRYVYTSHHNNTICKLIQWLVIRKRICKLWYFPLWMRERKTMRRFYSFGSISRENETKTERKSLQVCVNLLCFLETFLFLY